LIKATQALIRILDLAEFKTATSIGVYLSMPTGEISTDDIVKHALRQGKKVFVPYIESPAGPTTTSKPMEMLALRSIQELDELQRDVWGIPTLDNTSLANRENALGGFGICQEDKIGSASLVHGLDLILLPGLAFDQSRGRLGRGKGFYASSRYAAQLRSPRIR
jgi:5-formyltetrahydrofolate cyclo-ligase